MPKEDKVIWALIAVALAYFGAHIAWALMQPSATVAVNALTK